MDTYKRHRFPADIISYAVWLYCRFNLYHKDIEDLLAERRGKIVTDKLRSYGDAHRQLTRDVVHDTSQYANNRAELSSQPIRVRDRGMRRFRSIGQA